jgi:hypothetical protein
VDFHQKRQCRLGQLEACGFEPGDGGFVMDFFRTVILPTVLDALVRSA